jgi:CRISPR-associated endonuclease/helicase Cas3
LKWLDGDPKSQISELLREEKLDISAIVDVLSNHRQEAPEWCRELIDVATALPVRDLQLDLYPDEKGCVLSARRKIQPLDDEGADETSRSKAVLLEGHLTNVEAAVADLASILGDKTEECKWAAKFHDYGKADVRFQALLRNGDMMAAQFAPKPLAKSDSFPVSPAEGKKRRERIGLPDGFRHELLSLLFAEDAMQGESAAWDLGLHLIAAHHGRCRPFAPVVFDEAPVDTEFGGALLAGSASKKRAAHRLDSGVADRFWDLTRKHGWWGLAYYEALFRLADWTASASEAAKVVSK